MRIVIDKKHADWSAVKNEQLIRLERTDKYMYADRCGISEDSQSEIVDYRDQIRRIDHSFAHPDHVVWPIEPIPRKD